MDLRNPFVPNHSEVLNETYTNCLKRLQLSLPVNLSPLFKFLKSIAEHVKNDMS